ncbi:MAG TPA: MBL fold metallo-hydrolase [Crenotrichaceae bacterium]|nr:MBL fold metallo-hydrolase [Crenotrichaceae bacterium]
MKQLHRKDLFGWSVFDEQRNLDFHSVLWIREQDNIMIDPLPLSAHDQTHLKKLGGVSTIIITNSDHLRDAESIAETNKAVIYGPAGEKDSFPVTCNRWISHKQEIVPGLIAYEMQGSKTPGELALLLEQTTLITGDLIRCHRGGELCLLPAEKLMDAGKAADSVRAVAAIPTIDTVINGDGWPVFHHGHEALMKLTDSL